MVRTYLVGSTVQFLVRLFSFVYFQIARDKGVVLLIRKKHLLVYDVEHMNTRKGNISSRELISCSSTPAKITRPRSLNKIV